MTLVRAVHGPKPWLLIDLGDDTWCFQDSHGFFMDIADMRTVITRLSEFVATVPQEAIQAHNVAVQERWDREAAEMNRPIPRPTVPGYCILVRAPELGLWKWLKVAPGRQYNSGSVDEKFAHKLASLPHDYPFPVEAVKAYRLNDVHRFYTRVLRLVAHAYTDAHWLELHGDDLALFAQDTFGPELTKLVVESYSYRPLA